MEQIVKKMKDMGMGGFMDKSRQELCMFDTTYLRDNEAEKELEERYIELDLTRHQRMLVNDYVACMETTRKRYADISYAAGVKDSIMMLIRLGALKEIRVSEDTEVNFLRLYNI